MVPVPSEPPALRLCAACEVATAATTCWLCGGPTWRYFGHEGTKDGCLTADLLHRDDRGSPVDS